MARLITNSIQIQAPADRVWNALVNPSETRKYMFGCEAVSDWQQGSPLNWQCEFENRMKVFVTGQVLAIRPGTHLAYTTFDPSSALENIPGNYLTVTYDLQEEGPGITRLTVTQGDYDIVADGDQRYEEAYNGGEGWSPILRLIKAQVENG